MTEKYYKLLNYDRVFHGLLKTRISRSGPKKYYKLLFYFAAKMLQTMGSKKRKRGGEKPTIHPRNKYAENPPDFAFLASLYPTFQQFVFYTRDGRPRIDWTDFNATRELTRVLLLHDHGLNWWIPDGQLCPTVPSRSNYIHWIEDLLASDIIPSTRADGDVIKGFDIGTGANCIYPLLGASLLGWRFVGSDVTEVALEWAEKNVKSNPHISELIEIRRVSQEKVTDKEELHNREANDDQSNADSSNVEAVDIQRLPASSASHSGLKESYHGPPVLLGVVGEGEKFDFCMCNPPFFESIVEAGLNPKTACGGTPEEMVCPGGEQAFITCIIEDSIKLKQSFRWYTSMLGRKSNLKALVAKLWDVGVTIVKTTEFVQGQTSRWGLAWSFVPPVRKTISSPVMEKSNLSFMLEGVQRQYSAIHVLQSVESYFSSAGASCKLDSNSFHIDVIASKDQCDTILKTETQHEDEAVSLQCEMEASNSSNHLNSRLNNLHLRISVFQQIPGTLLVKGSMQQRESPFSGAFSLMFQKLEGNLRSKFCREKGSAGGSSFKHKRDQHTY